MYIVAIYSTDIDNISGVRTHIHAISSTPIKNQICKIQKLLYVPHNVFMFFYEL